MFPNPHAEDIFSPVHRDAKNHIRGFGDIPVILFHLVMDGVHMSKRGSPYLRRAIWMACTNAVQCDPMFHAYYEKKAAEGMRYSIIGHVTRKMAAVIFAVLRAGQAYQPVLPAA